MQLEHHVRPRARTILLARLLIAKTKVKTRSKTASTTKTATVACRDSMPEPDAGVVATAALGGE